jgi:hypothetical protein
MIKGNTLSIKGQEFEIQMEFETFIFLIKKNLHIINYIRMFHIDDVEPEKKICSSLFHWTLKKI